jgi:hypothetical protein
MRQLRSSRRLVKMWHRHEKVTIDHVIRTLSKPKPAKRPKLSPFTASGLSVEEQIHKAWHPGPLGLATF